MEQYQQYSVASFERVQQLLDAHPEVFGVFIGSAARAQLDSAVAQILAQSNAQGAAVRNVSGQVAVKDAAVKTLRLSHMQPIAKFARTQLKGAPDYTALTDSGLDSRGAKLVEAARAMATAAAPFADQLIAAQFPSDVIVALSAAADAVAQAMSAKADTNRQMIEATASIREQVTLGKQAVAMLDPVVSKLIVGNPVLVAAWRSAKHITVRSSGASQVVVPVPPVVPSSSSSVAAHPARTSLVADGSAVTVGISKAEVSAA